MYLRHRLLLSYFPRDCNFRIFYQSGRLSKLSNVRTPATCKRTMSVRNVKISFELTCYASISSAQEDNSICGAAITQSFPVVQHFYYLLLTCINCTTLLVSSRKAIADDVVNELAPLCSPLMTRPSRRYWSIGSHTRSTRPWNNCRKECTGPTPPSIPGSCVPLMSASHSDRA